jgi:hypothetical protein
MNCRSLLALILAVSLLSAASPAAASPAKALGQVLQSDRGHLGQAVATPGAAVFAGDTLSTEDHGKLHVRTGAAQLYLLANSAVSLDDAGKGAGATLLRGTIVFSAATSGALELRASTARLRAKGDVPAVAQVTLLGPKELLVSCRRGTLEFAVNDASDVIPEGASYRVLIDPPPALVDDANANPPLKAGKRNLTFLFILIGTGAALTGWAIHKALESPDRP